MNKTIGYGTTHRTRTHIIANWTDGTRTYAHARPYRRGNAIPPKREWSKLERFVADAKLDAETRCDAGAVNALDEVLHSIFNWDFEPRYPAEAKTK